MSPSNPGNPPLGALDTGPILLPSIPKRDAPYGAEPGYYQAGALWLYGNVKLLHGTLAHVPMWEFSLPPSPFDLDAIEKTAEEIVLSGKILVCGVHNAAQQRAAMVPLRWGAPRIVVFSGGFFCHLGKDIAQEPFRAARLWRYQWDRRTDLAVSRRAPEKLPTFATVNPTIDRLITALATGTHPGLSSPVDSLTPPLESVS